MKSLSLKRPIFFNLLISCMLAFAVADTSAPAASSTKRHHEVRHFVAFKFKDSVTQKQIDEINSAFLDLKKKVPLIVDIESGTNVSPEHLNKGLTHGYLVTFANEKDRDAYLVHPEHKKFLKLLKPALDDSFVFDFVP